MNKNERLDDHQKFKELAALAQRGALSDIERTGTEPPSAAFVTPARKRTRNTR